MGWLIGLGIVAASWIFWWYYGKGPFWKLCARYPDAAYLYMRAYTDAWIVLPSAVKAGAPQEFVGPFRLFVPAVQDLVRIYGHATHINDSQNEFVRIIRRFEQACGRSPELVTGAVARLIEHENDRRREAGIPPGTPVRVHSGEPIASAGE